MTNAKKHPPKDIDRYNDQQSLYRHIVNILFGKQLCTLQGFPFENFDGGQLSPYFRNSGWGGALTIFGCGGSWILPLWWVGRLPWTQFYHKPCSDILEYTRFFTLFQLYWCSIFIFVCLHCRKMMRKWTVCWNWNIYFFKFNNFWGKGGLVGGNHFREGGRLKILFIFCTVTYFLVLVVWLDPWGCSCKSWAKQYNIFFAPPAFLTHGAFFKWPYDDNHPFI